MSGRNAEVAAAFDEIADRMLLKGESWFKVRAYRAGADAIRSAGSVEELIARGELAKLPHVGKAIAEKTRSYLDCGAIPLLERLRGEVPAGLLLLVRAGMPPFAVRRAHGRFGVDGPDTLRAALAAGRLDGDSKLRDACQEALAKLASGLT